MGFPEGRGEGGGERVGSGRETAFVRLAGGDVRRGMGGESWGEEVEEGRDGEGAVAASGMERTGGG